MNNLFFEKPILNSPYEYPARHWELNDDDQPTQQIVERRRRAEFITPIPKPRKRKGSPKQLTLVFDEGKGLSTQEQQLYRVKYVEKAGTGTTDMIADCRKAGFPEPDFEQHGPYFVVTVWRDWLTDEVLAGYKLSDRQQKAINHVKVTGRINNAQYRDLMGISPRTALRELRQLTDFGIFTKVGGTGQSAHYVIVKANSVVGTGGKNPS